MSTTNPPSNFNELDAWLRSLHMFADSHCHQITHFVGDLTLGNVIVATLMVCPDTYGSDVQEMIDNWATGEEA